MSTLKARPRTSLSPQTAPTPRRGRAAFEFYPTPPEATRALLSVEAFDGDIWEPACGDGAISKVLEAAGHTVISTDLIDRDYGTGGQNFLKSEKPLAKNIITNPPYGTHGLGDAFVRQVCFSGTVFPISTIWYLSVQFFWMKKSKTTRAKEVWIGDDKCSPLHIGINYHFGRSSSDTTFQSPAST